jgi:hypothetical protein
MIILLNTSIITDYGTFNYEPFTVEQARRLVHPFDCTACGGSRIPCQYCGGTGVIFPVYESAIGHESTAEILTQLLGVHVVVNRQNYAQKVGDEGLVFKLKVRAPEGVILSREEIEALGYEFGLLTRTN